MVVSSDLLLSTNLSYSNDLFYLSFLYTYLRSLIEGAQKLQNFVTWCLFALLLPQRAGRANCLQGLVCWGVMREVAHQAL